MVSSASSMKKSTATMAIAVVAEMRIKIVRARRLATDFLDELLSFGIGWFQPVPPTVNSLDHPVTQFVFEGFSESINMRSQTFTFKIIIRPPKGIAFLKALLSIH